MTEAWRASWRADPVARAIADRHYNRQKVGATQFVPPGRCHVMLAGEPDAAALWVTSWPFAEFVKHAWAGAWMCSIFRNEGAGRSSRLIQAAVVETVRQFGEPPYLGMVTFVDPRKTRPKRHPGHSFIIAGFRPCGFTKGGLHALKMPPSTIARLVSKSVGASNGAK